MSARPRWRWITLAEFVAIAGLVIAVVTLWLSWSDRRADSADRRRAEAAETHDRARLALTGTVVDGGDSVTIADAHHELTDTVIAFPTPLGVAAQHPVTPRIEADWIAKPVLDDDGSKKADEGRLPVLVTVSYLDGDVRRMSRGLYMLAWRRVGHFPFGHGLKLEGFRIWQPGGSQAALDRTWAGIRPR